jgi:hypothetical protein
MSLGRVLPPEIIISVAEHYMYCFHLVFFFRSTILGYYLLLNKYNLFPIKVSVMWYAQIPGTSLEKNFFGPDGLS